MPPNLPSLQSCRFGSNRSYEQATAGDQDGRHDRGTFTPSSSERSTTPSRPSAGRISPWPRTGEVVTYYLYHQQDRRHVSSSEILADPAVHLDRPRGRRRRLWEHRRAAAQTIAPKFPRWMSSLYRSGSSSTGRGNRRHGLPGTKAGSRDLTAESGFPADRPDGRIHGGKSGFST
jgi:hypothetical protein